ncbi:MAG: DUF2089 family protein [Fibrobacteria bacterium]|nr:DUF2089 family protein [Fibrobacteria bacterium]
MRLSSVFKILKGPIQIERVRCKSSGFAVEGPFSTPAIFQLNEEQLHLVEALVMHGGNLKKVAEEIDISYPTLKNRLDAVANILKRESEFLKSKRISILDAIEKGEVSADEGADLLEAL